MKQPNPVSVDLNQDLTNADEFLSLRSQALTFSFTLLAIIPLAERLGFVTE